jgi:LmbE family N-acetylglucosaminyl deacetylase
MGRCYLDPGAGPSKKASKFPENYAKRISGQARDRQPVSLRSMNSIGQQLRLMCVVAHPDDESLGMGGTLAKYAAEGVETYVVTATRGERGRSGTPEPLPPDEVGSLRLSELQAAARQLGVKEVSLLGYCDAGLDQAEPNQAIARIAAHLRRVRPHVVLTFGPEGAYGHPDHIAICQFTTAALICAADCNYKLPDGYSAHRVSKLYYMACRGDKWAAYQQALRKLAITVDGVERSVNPWPDWAISADIETSAFAPQVWRAVCCHQSQMAIYSQLSSLSEEHHRSLWGSQQYYRAFSLVNGGRGVESDLFEGLR